MTTQLISAGKTLAYSSTFTLEDGETAELFLTGGVGKRSAPLDAVVYVEQQTSDLTWMRVASVTARSAVTLSGAGVFRLQRPAQIFDVGVQRG